ncbi:CRISPR-associated endonuclease Cas2 [Candidatus Uhrbacteria bacterium]|nr:CRISPR-associated endonuclease Cas2 [Candidatus Uhrbacteria bacterium]
MEKGTKKVANKITKLLRQVQDDWFSAELVLPSYKGIRYSSRCIGRVAPCVPRRTEERRTLHYLKRKGWIETSKTAKGLMIRLSQTGKMERLLRTMQDRPMLKRGARCLVVFDIPEQARKSRDAFRHFLKAAGLSLIQRSVWSTDRDVLKDVSRFIADAGIGKWVQIFVGTDVYKNLRS